MLVPIFIRSAPASRNNVIALESGSTCTARSRALPTIGFRDAACESAVFFIVRIEGWGEGVGAECFGAHQLESLRIGKGFPRESLTGLPGLLLLFEAVAFEHEDQRFFLNRR
jgi:hypothetical protein